MLEVHAGRKDLTEGTHFVQGNRYKKHAKLRTGLKNLAKLESSLGAKCWVVKAGIRS